MEANYNMVNGSNSVPLSTPGHSANLAMNGADKKKNKMMLYGMIVLAVLAVGGIGFGIWAMVDGNIQKAQLNSQIAVLNERIEELGGWEEDEPYENDSYFGKPESVDQIDSIFISYNGGKDFVDILEGEVRYYAFDEEGNTTDETSNVLEVDTTGLKQYVFNNDLEYLGSYYPEEEYEWLVVVNGVGMSSTAYGVGEYPEWFAALLKELKVDEHGYLHK